ncbi:MAG: AAA family ATPase, partial [Gammaproteobacteria bacterium]|nr:AAA family ATPase [Gammaproteobacteria bacterium]NIX10076.1 AAA family ATPase [Gammaproteobacteria bacterium]
YLLRHYDHEFDKLFKVVADFSYRTERSADNNQLYARMIATQQQADNLKPLQAPAVARVIEAASRHADDSTKLTL